MSGTTTMRNGAAARLGLSLAVAGLAAVATPALAGPPAPNLADPFLSASVTIGLTAADSGTGAQPRSEFESGSGGGFGSSSAAVTGGVQLGAQAAGDAQPFNFQSGAGVTYQFEIVGPTSGLIPIDLIANLTTSAVGGAQAQGFLTLTQGAIGFEFDVCAVTDAQCLQSNWAIDQTLSFKANTPVNVSERITTDTRGGAETATASADPFLAVEPGFLGQNPGFDLFVSEGIDNVNPNGAAVPEPQAWALLILGFGGVGAMLRRRNVFGSRALGLVASSKSHSFLRHSRACPGNP
jgi:hypothetical protein